MSGSSDGKTEILPRKKELLPGSGLVLLSRCRCVPSMTTQDRFLQFDNFDPAEPALSSGCSHCRAEFNAKPKPSELTAALHRMRAAFNSHECK